MLSYYKSVKCTGAPKKYLLVRVDARRRTSLPVNVAAREQKWVGLVADKSHSVMWQLKALEINQNNSFLSKPPTLVDILPPSNESPSLDKISQSSKSVQTPIFFWQIISTGELIA